MAEKSIASSKSGSKQGYIIQEKTGLERISAEIKDSTFQVLYLILKEEDDSFLGFAIGMGADYLQMAAFAFDNQVSGIWKAQDFLSFVFSVFSFFQLQTYFSDAFTFTNFLIAFYILVAVLVLTVINILYVSIAFSKKRVTAIWPVTVLRAVAGLFFTVFFLPITETLISMLECSYDEAGDYVHSNYPEIKCFQGAHIIHATIAILVIIVFVILGFIVALAYFEIRMMTEDVTARQHSRGDVVFILNKIILQLSFSFFSAEYQWLLVLIIAVGALLLWRSFNIGEPYYKKESTLFFKIITSYYLWTALLLFFSKVLEETSFDGGLITWFIGLPFLGVILLTSSKSNTQSLSRGTSRFKTSQDLMDHLRYVLQLIDIYDSDKNARILLTGYIEKHKDTCEEEDCPLKIKRKKRVSLGTESNEIALGLILAVDRMYQNGLKKFKSSAKLRIAYAVFLIERMKKLKKAEQELTKAKELNPGFEDQFVIFRLTKMIADGMEGVDVVGLIAWDNYKNLYQEFVRESADLHKEFWSELREDTPNLHKLSYLGSRVNNAMSLASEYWNKVQKVRPDDPIILKTYGRFLIDIQNDVVEGYDLIEKSKKLMKKMIHHQFAKRNSFDAGLDSLPYVEVVGSGQDMGKIKQANLLFTVLVGVNRDEILEKKINIFMPELFAQYHDSFMKRYLNREDEYDIGYLDNDNSFFVRTKSGYIIPVTLRVSKLKTEETTNQIVFGAWFRTETAKRTYVHLVCSKDGTIVDMSASAVTILNFSYATVKKSKMNIDKLVPNALTDKAYREGGKEIVFKLNETTTLYFIATITPVVLKDDKNMEFFSQYAVHNPTQPLTIADKSYGYIVKLDKLEKNGELTNAETTNSSKLYSEKKKKKDTIFTNLDRENSMKSEPSRQSKVDNLEADGSKKEDNGQIIWGFNTDYAELEISELFQNDGGVKLDIDKLVKQEEEVEREKKDYGMGISLKKYQQGYLYEVREDDEVVPIVDEDDEEGSLFNRKDDDEDMMVNKKRKDKMSSLKRLVRDALEANQRGSAVTPIRWLTLGWLLMVFTISILQYVLLSELFGDYGNKIHVVRALVEKLTEVDSINAYITDFMVFDAYPQLETDYANAKLDDRKKGVRECVNRIVNLTNELEEEDLYKFISPYIRNKVSITIYGTEVDDEFSLNETEAVFFISSRAYNLLDLYEGQFDTNNTEVLSVLGNFYNEILPALRQSTNELQASLTRDLGSFEYEFILLFAANGITALLISIWGMVLLLVIDQQKEDILFLFLEIPPSNVDSISRKRDKFTEFFDTTIRQLQNNPEDNHQQEENTESDVSMDEKPGGNIHGSVFDDSLKDGTFRSKDPNSLGDEDDALKDRKKLIKKFKSKKFTQVRSGIFRVILLIIISIAYSISISASIIVNKNDVAHYSSQFFTTNLLSDSILSTINTNRLMRLDSDFDVQGQAASQAGLEALWALNTLGGNLGDFFLYVISQDNSLESEITTLFFGNACSILTNDTVQPACEDSLSHALKLGIFNLKEQVFKILMKEYNIFQNTGTTTADDHLQLFTLNDEFKEYTYNILQQFNVNEENFLIEILDNAVSLQEILIIVYLVLTTTMILIFWLPYLSRLNAEVWRTTRMINMIPLDVVNNIPSIKRYLKNLVRKSIA